jgi:ABC-type multidrug transport system ATPase subunit
MIDLIGISLHYSVRPILRDLSLHIAAGELVAIVGPNGMGKSSLLNVMAGVHQPQQGQVVIEGRVRRRSEEDELAIRRRVVYLPDHPWLPDYVTGRNWVLAAGRLYDIPEERLFDHLDRMLPLFHLEEVADDLLMSYSAGQKKKIALAGALIADTPILLLDEPFSGGLDPSGIVALKHVLRRLVREQSKTIVMTTPVPEILEDLADRVAILHDGQVTAIGTIGELRQQAKGAATLAEALERMTHSETLSHIASYFARDRGP